MKAIFVSFGKLYRESYSGHAREIWLLAFLTLINRMGTMVLPFLTVYLTTVLGFSLEQAGFLASAFGVGSLIGSILGGKLTDRWGPMRVIFMSLAISGVLLVCLQFARGFWMIFGMIALTATFGEAYRPALTTAVGIFAKPQDRGRSMAFLRLAVNLGMSAAPAVGGFVATFYGYHALFWIDGVTCFSASLFLVWVFGIWRKRNTEKKQALSHDEETQTVLPPYRNIPYVMLLISTFVLGLGFIQWFHSVPVFIKKDWGYDERYIGIIMAINALLVALIEMPIIHSMEKKGLMQVAIKWGTVLIGLSFLPFVFPNALWLCFAAMLLMTFGEILVLPFNNALALNMSPEHKRGSYMAGYWMTWSLATIIGPTMGLGISAKWGFPVLAMILVIVLPLSIFIRIKSAQKLQAETV